MSRAATPAEKAAALLANQSGSATERAQVWATLAVADAVDRLADTLGPLAGSDR